MFTKTCGFNSFNIHFLWPQYTFSSLKTKRLIYSYFFIFASVNLKTTRVSVFRFLNTAVKSCWRIMLKIKTSSFDSKKIND